MPPLTPLLFGNDAPSEWITQVGVGGAFVVVVLLILWKAGVFVRRDSRPLSSGDLDPAFWAAKFDTIKGAVDAVEKQIATTERTLAARIEANHDELVAIRSRLHELRDLLSPLAMTVELCTEELRKART